MKYTRFKAWFSSGLLFFFFTSVNDLPTHRQHDLTVASRVGHQIEDLLVRTSLHHHAVDAHELISSSQPSVFLCGSVWNDGPDVDLGKDVLREG